MAAVTQTIQNYLGGVSNQPDDKKLPGQVTGATNAYPDPTFGLTKRPGFKFLAELKDGITTAGSSYDETLLDNAKWFYYNRDTDEKYLGCIVGKSTSSYGEIHVWNTVLDDNVVATVDTYVAGDTYAVGAAGTYLNTTSDGSGTGLTIRITSISGGGSTGPITGVEVIDGGKGYAVDETITIPGGNGAGRVDVATIKSGVLKKCHMTYGTDAREYLGKKESADAIASTLSTDYDFLTIRDASIITNKNRVITTTDAPTSEPLLRNVTVRIHSVEYSSHYVITLITGGVTYVATVKTGSGDTATNDADTSKFLSAEDILNDLRSGSETGNNDYTYLPDDSTTVDDGINGITNITATVINNTLEITGTANFTVSVTGGRTGTALTSYGDSVDSITQLSTATKHGRKIQILNTSGSFDKYYAKFVADDTTNSGPGVWEETVAGNVSLGLTDTNMPHQLSNNARNHFTFAKITWVQRVVGDDDTNEHPSFNGKTIQQAFYYNNRLGFLTEDNVSMSQSGAFYNFYMTSAQTSTDADPVDLSCSSVRPAVLHGIIPSASGLLLFSQNQQFVMFSADGNLTPTTALIRGLSNYRMDSTIDPVDVGTYVNFVSKTHDTAGYTRMFALQPQGIGQIPRVVDIGRIVAEYVPATITNLTASPQNSFVVMYGKTLDDMYFYRTYSDGEKDIVQAWFDWKAPGNIHYVTVDSDTMFSIIKTGSGSDARYNLVSATMTQTPEEEILETSTGQQVNPHMDFYTAATNGASTPVTVVYDSDGDFSKCYIPFKDVTTLDPVILISGSKEDFSGVTESGLTLTPTRASDGSGTYFKVAGRDLSGQADKVFLGYKYSYDITLPKIYFQKDPSGKLADYTANLTIARMKFSVGRSSVLGFKIQRKGFQAQTLSYTGDGSTTAFSPTFKVQDKKDIKVKRNGAVQTLVTDYSTHADAATQADLRKSEYKISDHSTLTDRITITFGTAPAAETTAANKTTAADTIEIYIRDWFTLMPTIEANQYLADDVPLDTQSLFTVPIHQKPNTYTLRVFSDSPFPVALTSMSWEGNYSPRYYRRT